jgi:hypothetical protein
MGQLLGDPSQSAYAQAIAQTSLGDNAVTRRLLREALALDPDNQAARFDLIRPYLAALSADRAPPEIAAEVAALPSTPAAILAAGRHAVAGEWDKIPPLEDDMAAARFTDTWYPESVQMRADWRTRVKSEEHRARLGREALALIEETIVSQPNAAMFALRARGAAAANRPDIVLESINGYAQSILNSVPRLTSNELPALSGMLETLLKPLEQLAADTRVNQDRVREVRERITVAREQLLERADKS